MLRFASPRSLIGSTVTIIFGVLVAAPAAAQMPTQADQADGPRGSIYARLGAGIIWNDDLDLDVDFSPNAIFPAALPGPATGLASEYGAGAQYVGAIGFSYPNGTRTELEYRYSSIEPDLVRTLPEGGFGVSAASASGDFRTHVLMSNVYYDFRNSSRLTPYIGAGVGGVFIEEGQGLTDSAFAYQAKAGFSYEMAEDWSVDLEYLYARSSQLVFGTDEFSTDTSIIDPPRFDGDRYEASSVLASIRKTF